MKHIYLFLLACITFSIAQAQIVDIPDAAFKSYLVNSICADLNNDGYVESVVDVNNDGEIQVSEAEAVFFLEINQECNATSIVGIESFINLNEFSCLNTNIINLDLSFLTTIGEINISENNNLTSVDLSQLVSTNSNFYCYNNASLANLDLIGLTSVGRSLYFAANNSLFNLNLSNLQTINTYLDIINNSPSTPLNVNLSSLTNVNQLINISDNNLNSINLDNLTTIHGLFFRNNTTITDLNLSSVISNDMYITSSQGIEITSPDLLNINLESLQSSIERIFITNVGNTMSVNLDSFNDIATSNLTLSYNAPLVSLPSLVNAGNITIAGDIQEVNLQSLETGGLFVNTTNDDLNTINLSSLTYANSINLNNNQLTSLDLNNLISIDDLYVSRNQLTSISLNNLETASSIGLNTNLLTDFELSNVYLTGEINLSANPLTNLDLNNVYTSFLLLSNSEFDMLDLSSVSLTSLYISNNENLYYLDIKNGTPLISNSTFSDLPNLLYICADSSEIDYIKNQLDVSGISNCQVNTYCSFVPGGEYYTIEGGNRLDLNNDGCDTSDQFMPNFKCIVTNGTVSSTVIPDGSGVYSITAQEGIHTITPILENPDYFNVSPESFTVDFPSEASPYIQDFCITPNGEKDDLEIVIIPLEVARPGFDTDYKIVYKNKGNTTLTGTLELIYNENAGLMDFVSATPNIDSDIANVLTWSYSNLQPFETREILVTFNLNTPTETPPLNDGDPLGLVANIYPLETDETISDNNFQLKQIVVNSFDPNDKTCLQGEIITPDQVGKYVHYMIRFENTGTASAVNIVVKDEIDLSKYDVSTLIPLHASHDFVTNIKEDNIVEFIFEDINLPFDDANNDGYVAFKIKTLATLVLGDSFANDAEIYFDYNAPIITNNEETTIGENLSVEETSMQDFVTLYPNPINNVLHIKSKNTLETVSIYDVNGRQLQTISFTGNKLDTEINTSAFSQGVYFVKIKTEIGIQTTKIIKN